MFVNEIHNKNWFLHKLTVLKILNIIERFTFLILNVFYAIYLNSEIHSL